MGEIQISNSLKTSLPPRKRAKTKEEKEQRRVERILRNRKAAHASREKKRRHVEFLESYVVDLEKQLSLFGELNQSLLSKFYPGDDADVNKMVDKIKSLPSLEQMKLEHSISLEEHRSSSISSSDGVPKTPESITSVSPKPHFDDMELPELETRSNSLSCDSSYTELDFTDLISTDSNRFSLDIITGEPQPDKLQASLEVLNDEPHQQVFQSFIKKEDVESPSLSLTSYSEKNTPFDDYQVNTFDNDFVFGELRNPAVITMTLSLKVV